MNARKWCVNVIYLPSKTHLPEGFPLSFGAALEELTVNHGVQEPLPVFLRDVGDEPSKALAMEADLVGQTGLDQVVG